MNQRLTLTILKQAWPILIGQLASVAYGVIDTIMTGHSSQTDLAAMAIGASVYASVFVSLMGTINALNPIAAQHYGARRYEQIGESFMQAVWLALGLSALGCIPLLLPYLWLDWFNTTQEVKQGIAGYLNLLGIALPASLIFRAIYALNTAVSRPKVIMTIQLLGLLLKIGLNTVFIFGKLGCPRLGVIGCGLASLIVYWALFLMGWACLRKDPFYRRFAIRWNKPDMGKLKELMRLGIPMGLGYALEITSFTFMTLLLARLGPALVGAHQIMSNLAAFSYMMPLSLGVATATLTAQALGAQDTKQAQQTAWTGIHLATALAILTVAILWSVRFQLIGVYTSDPIVAATALSLVGFLFTFHLFDAIQAVTGFVLRAYKIAFIPTLVSGFALWGIGLMGGYIMAFSPPWGIARGVSGMWLMQSVALGTTALILVCFYGWLTHTRLTTNRAAQTE